MFRAPTIADAKSAGKVIARLEQRRRRARSLRTNRITFAFCTALAVVAAWEHLVVTSFFILGCVAALGVLMAKNNETEWAGAIEDWESVVDLMGYCDVLADDHGLTFICFRGAREPRKRCAFCSNRASVQCDGDRCIRPLCDDHRWEARPAVGDGNVSLDFCPICEAKLLAGAKLPVQIGLFAS